MMTSLSLLLILFAPGRAATPPYSCSAAEPQTRHLPFCNRTLPTLSRARDLVSRLTLDEKIAQLVNTAHAVPRLGVPAFEWWSEALHGVAGAGKGIHFDRGRIKAATSFPQVILSAASFDAYLWYRIGQFRYINSTKPALINHTPSKVYGAKVKLLLPYSLFKSSLDLRIVIGRISS